MGTDFKLIDVPSMMARVVKRQSPGDPDSWIRDEAWYSNIRKIYESYIGFLSDHGLLKRDIETTTIDDVVIMFSDLNDLGKAFVETGADERWLESFDRPGSKKQFNDVRYMEKALQKLIGSTH